MNPRFSCFIFFLSLILFSCEKEFSKVGSSLLPSDNFIIENQIVFPDVEHKGIEIIRSDNLDLFYLGDYHDQFFGNTSASFTTQLSLPLASTSIFGKMSTDEEINGVSSEAINKFPHDEEETVREVWLEIPFYTNQRDRDGDGVIDVFDIDPDDPQSDSDGDTLTDMEESRSVNYDPLNPDTDGDGINDADDDETINPDIEAGVYDIEYFYGDNSQQFHFIVKRLNYFLSDLDPENNFESEKAFYSNKDFEQEGLTSEILFDDYIDIDFNEIVTYKSDDLETEDIDESIEVDERLTPRVRIPLEKSFFQQLILEKEGDDVLIDNNRFKEYLNGIVISLKSSANSTLMQLNFGSGEIRIEYDYKELVLADGGDASKESDYIIQDSSETFNLSLTGVRFNTIKQDNPTSEVLTALNGDDSGQNIYLKGGLGVISYINLFNEVDGHDQLAALQENPWLINEANLTLYVDKEKMDAVGFGDLPSRLYLFDASQVIPLVDFNLDLSSGPNPTDNKSTFGGFAQYDENGEIISYKFLITNHLSNIIRNPENYNNVRLGLTVSTDYLNIQNTIVTDPESFDVPQSSINTPLGVILAGPNHDNSDLRLQLEIFYTTYE